VKENQIIAGSVAAEVGQRYLPPDGKVRRLTGVLPIPTASLKVGRGVPAAPPHVVQFPTVQAPLDARGAVGTPRPTHDPIRQHAQTSAAAISFAFQSERAEQGSAFPHAPNQAWRRN
jgi:hypothetical protein